MALEFDADFDGYFDNSYGHGVAATYTVSGGSATTIKVILEDEYLSVDGLTVGVEGSTPVAYCKTKDVSSASHGDTLAFSAQTDLDGNTLKGAKTYSVVNVQPDNTGITALILQEQ